MIFLGVFLIVIGFALVVPRGGIPGSAANRNVTIGDVHLVQTPGYSDQPRRRGQLIRIAVGVAMLIGGLLTVWFGG